MVSDTTCFVCGHHFKDGDIIDIEFRNMKKMPVIVDNTAFVEISKDAIIDFFHEECRAKYDNR